MNNLIRSGLLMISAISPSLAAAEGWTGFYAGAQIGSIDTDISFYGRTMSEDSGTYGLLVGYNHAFANKLVLGVELNADKLNYTEMPFKHDLMARRIKTRLGYDFGNVMLYGTLGYAEIGDGTGNNEDGTTAGFGVDYKVTDALVLGAEVLRDSFEFAPINMNITSLRLRVSYQF
ncbi:porin family protein [Sedimentitalea todarodis]|uniref:Porin family protein n=1 Tax=Sedimentitalea todarodis TaxID=1631240 RepID=A0ABU3VI70_9RHOB|nr:porin family protein [Sedimentitalea todarodis]MDU9005710.1 porin family protein [Sedimentitalea todarodis]